MSKNFDKLLRIASYFERKVAEESEQLERLEQDDDQETIYSNQDLAEHGKLVGSDSTAVGTIVKVYFDEAKNEFYVFRYLRRGENGSEWTMVDRFQKNKKWSPEEIASDWINGLEHDQHHPGPRHRSLYSTDGTRSV